MNGTYLNQLKISYKYIVPKGTMEILECFFINILSLTG